MKPLITAVISIALSSFSAAEAPRASHGNHQPGVDAWSAQKDIADTVPPNPLGPADCAFTFTSGAGSTFFKYCVTADGNVSVFQTPEGHEHIAVSTIGEGYGICDATNFGIHTEYFDYAEFGESGNWDAARVVSHTAKSVKIARTTSDGVWTLTQTFTQVSGNTPSLKIAMALKNNTDAVRAADVLRYANVEADGISSNNLDESFQSAFGWNSAGGTNPYGLVLQNAGDGSSRAIRQQ